MYVPTFSCCSCLVIFVHCPSPAARRLMQRDCWLLAAASNYWFCSNVLKVHFNTFCSNHDGAAVLLLC